MTKQVTIHKLYGLLLGAIVLTSSFGAEAQYIEQRFMLGFSQGLFEFSSDTMSPDYSSDDLTASKPKSASVIDEDLTWIGSHLSMETPRG
jgi:hypothetical protein